MQISVAEKVHLFYGSVGLGLDGRNQTLLRLTLTTSGRLRITGNQVQIDRALPIVAQYEAQLVDALQVQANAEDRP